MHLSQYVDALQSCRQRCFPFLPGDAEEVLNMGMFACKACALPLSYSLPVVVCVQGPLHNGQK